MNALPVEFDRRIVMRVGRRADPHRAGPGFPGGRDPFRGLGVGDGAAGADTGGPSYDPYRRHTSDLGSGRETPRRQSCPRGRPRRRQRTPELPEGI